MKGNTYHIFGEVAVCVLSNGALALVSTASVPLLENYTWCLSGNGYAMTRSCTPSVSMHRLLKDAQPGDIVDHADRNPLNNTLENLRICTKVENSINTKLRSDNSVGFKGVSFHKGAGKYRAYINVNGKQKSLGLFEKAEDAAERYIEAARELFGEFATEGVGARCS